MLTFALWLNSTYKHFFAFKGETVFIYFVCRHTFFNEEVVVLFLLNLREGGGYGVLQGAFIIGIMYLEFDNIGIIIFILWLKHDVISAEAAFPV